jgi:allantoin racemase
MTSGPHLLVINPNTTRSMTEAIGRAAEAAAAPGTSIAAVSPADGPPSIEGYYNEAFSVPGLLIELQKGADADAAILACFDDTGLDAARTVFDGPVVGIGEAAFHMATLIAGTFSVVTTLSRSVPAIEHNLVRYGLANRCRSVRASEVPVLALEDPASDARRRISEEIARALADDRAEAIVLGCAGMAALAAALSDEHGVPVVDGVAAAVKLAEGLVALNLRTSRVGGYQRPGAKIYAGRFASHSPGASLRGGTA